jgi:paraquat-inducible protein A
MPALEQTLAACPVCGLVQETGPVAAGEAAVCPRCGSEVYRRKPDSARRTLAFALAALIFYLPANYYPLVIVFHRGQVSGVTLWRSVRELFIHGQWGVGLLVFVTSMLTPALKLASLLLLAATAGSPRFRRLRTFLYHFVELVNPWNMLEVFMLALLVGIVKFREVATIVPDTGAWAFGALVALTILASHSFDPRLIWDEAAEEAP